MQTKLKALIVVPALIALLAGVFAVVGYFVAMTLGIPQRFDMPIALRACGLAVLGLGVAFMGWILKYRKPGDVLLSTFVTMQKALRRTPPQEAADRTEGLIVQGPQRHVRNPMYFAVVVLWLGWWLLLDYTVLLLMAGLFLLWFLLVVIPVEERELRAMFGRKFDAYARAVPKFVPSLKARWK